ENINIIGITKQSEIVTVTIIIRLMLRVCPKSGINNVSSDGSLDESGDLDKRFTAGRGAFVILGQPTEALSHPNVRSTIQRLGRTTKPTCPTSLRTTTPIQPQRHHASLTAVSKWLSPHSFLRRLTAPCSRSTRAMPPTRSWTEAGTTSNAHSRPSVSTATKRLRPMIFFFRIDPAWTALLGRGHRLAVEDGGRRLGRLAGRAADFVTQRVVGFVPTAVLLPGAEVMKHRPVGRQVVG